MDETASEADGPTQKTYYDVLGVAPDASQDRVHRAYVAVLAEFRANPTPDREDWMRRARIAYQVLSDPQGRALYNADRKLERPPQRRWEKYYLQAEEERFNFWSGVTRFGLFSVWGFFWPYVLLKGLRWLLRALSHVIEVLLARKRPIDEVPEQPIDPQGDQG